jgi:hypothetical protein
LIPGGSVLLENVLSIIKYVIRMEWDEPVVRMGERSDVYRVWVGKHEEKKPLRDPGVDVRLILRMILRK